MQILFDYVYLKVICKFLPIPRCNFAEASNRFLYFIGYFHCYWTGIRVYGDWNRYKYVDDLSEFNPETQGFSWQENEPQRDCVCLIYNAYLDKVESATQFCSVTNPYICQQPGKLYLISLSIKTACTKCASI